MQNAFMQNWKTIERRTILDYSRFLSVEQHTVELPDGQRISDWPWVVTPDFANVVAVDGDGRFLLFRQTKYAIEDLSLAPVGGFLEPGEDPLVAAKRELLEETGYASDNWQFLGKYAVDGNRGAGNAHFFLARYAKQIAPRNADDLEEQELIFLTQAEVTEALIAGKFKVLPWMAIISLALTQFSRFD